MTNNDKQPTPGSTNTDDPCDDVCGPDLTDWVRTKKDTDEDKHKTA